ncbi:CCA-adding protein [Buchnera aphidicola]|uniref:CCA-adding protein n=1 Tax=Buchnera aphidicola TaxID=9 RepID=UPI00094C3A7E|nr:CCA-adding protein [Buchnera aphidicola]
MKIYLVGGAIRDSLLGLAIHDRDWMVVGATPEQMLKKKYQQVGRDFPVFIHPKTYEEYALARTERKNGVGHTGFSVNFSPDVTLSEDLIRRDLTINAMAQDKNGNLIDLFFGKQDIKDRVLRHVSLAFQEDPLRVLRVARFAASLAHLGFQIAKETMCLMQSMCENKDLLHLFPERIWKETEKGLCTNNPHVYFQVLHSCHALNFLFPEIVFFYQYFFSVFLFEKKISAIKIGFKEMFRISKLTTDVCIRFSYFIQFLSRIYCVPDIFTDDYFFYKKPVILIQSLCARLKIPLEIKKTAVFMCGFHNFLQSINIQPTKLIIKFFDIIDVWRNPRMLKKFNYLKFYYTHVTFSFQKKVTLGDLLHNMFNVIKEISIQSIGFKKKLEGIAIRNELNRLRVYHLEKWRSLQKLNFIKKKY